jgi:hypothetical protein
MVEFRQLSSTHLEKWVAIQARALALTIIWVRAHMILAWISE